MFGGRFDSFKLLLVIAYVTTSVTSRQITVYDDEPTRHGRDYSDYVGDRSEDSGGFDEPIDFTPFFTAGFGAQSSSSNFFLPASSEVKPFSIPVSGIGSAFPAELEASATTNNGTGFTSPKVNFQSFFDATGSESQDGFRAQDFVKNARTNEDGITQESAPADFFFASSADFGYPEEIKKEKKISKQEKSQPSGGKSSYPSPSYRASPVTPRYTSASSPTNYKPVETYPSRSTATYNPTGPYLSKPSYKSPRADEPHYNLHASQDHESKSGYPKKASSQFHPTKIGRPSKFQSEEASPYAAAGASYDEHFLPGPSDPYSPSEYGKEFDTFHAEPAEQEETTVEAEKDGKHCRRVEKKLSSEALKSGQFDGDAMTCYVCEDPKTGGTFEKCSYESDPASKSNSYFHGHAKTFSTDKGTKPTSYRYRRGLRDYPLFSDFDSHYTYSEPLIRIARQDNPSYGSKYGTSYEDYIAKFASPSEKNYRYQPESYSSVEDDADYKTASTNNNKDCKTVVKGTMTCTVCQNPKTGGNSEQCSYATNPDDNKYFVARQSSFNSGNKTPYTRVTNERTSRPKDKSNENASAEQEEPSSRVPYEFSTESSAIVTRRGSHKGPIDLSSYPYASDRRSDESKVEPRTSYNSGKSYDDYFRELFPELSKSRNSGEESKNVERSEEEFGSPSRRYNSNNNNNNNNNRDVEEVPRKNKPRPTPDYNGRPVADYKEYAQESYVQSPTNVNEQTKNNNNNNAQSNENAEYYKALPDYFSNTEPKKDLERVLGEFSQKDRTDCKKVIRDKMTCYQCVDKKGMQHEECMFVAASEPKSQHLAYHEVKEFRLVPDAKPASSNLTDSISLPSLDLKKTTSPVSKPDVTVTKPVRVVKRIVRTRTTTTTTEKPSRRGRRSRDDLSTAAATKQEVKEEEEEVADKEFVVDRDGLYTSETRLAYDPVLKVSLPEYMLEKSEHEAIFDEVLASGK